MEKETLYRNTDNKMIAGVCAGLADYFEIDANLIRLITVIFAIGAGSGILAYFVAWALIPEKPSVN